MKSNPKLSDQSKGAGSSSSSASAANPRSKNGIGSTIVGGRSRDTIKRGDNKSMSRKSVPQCSRIRNGDKKLSDLRPSRGKTWNSRLIDSSRIDYARSADRINNRRGDKKGDSLGANKAEMSDKDGNPYSNSVPSLTILSGISVVY